MGSYLVKAYPLAFKITTTNKAVVSRDTRKGEPMKKMLAIIVLATSVVTFADHHEKKSEMKAEMKAKMAEHKAEVNQACAADAEKTGCAGKEVGSGLLKCLHAYKKEHKDFEISEGCKASTKNLRDEKKSWKEKKKSEKAAEKADN